MKQIINFLKSPKSPFAIAALALLVVRIVGLGRVLLLAAGAAAGYFAGQQKVKSDWDVIN